MEIANKRVLDVCCGGRMFWFDKKHHDALYRTVAPTKLSNGATFSVLPDAIMDFRALGSRIQVERMPYPAEGDSRARSQAAAVRAAWR
jgi:hypothetical protein